MRSQKNKSKTKTKTITYDPVCDKSRYYPRESVAKMQIKNTAALSISCPSEVILQSLQANQCEWLMRVVSSIQREHGPWRNLTEHYHWIKLTGDQVNFLADLILTGQSPGGSFINNFAKVAQGCYLQNRHL